MNTYKIDGEQTYERDTASKALVATDKNALQQHRKRLRDSTTLLSLNRELNSMRKELDLLKAEVALMKAYGNCQRKD